MNRGRRVGRQVQMMERACSIEDHMLVSTVLQVMSFGLEPSKATMRMMEMMQTLGVRELS